MSFRKTCPAFLLSVTVLLAIVAGGIWTSPARADGGTVPPPSSGSGTTRKAKGSSSSSTSQLPAGTKVVVLDSTGDKLPLGSQEAQQIVASGDPLWCPSTVSTPTPGSGGCTNPYLSLDLLTGDISTGAITLPQVNGTIWIEGSPPDASTNAISLNALALSTTPNKNIVNFSLTLKGGWNGCLSTPPYTCTNSIDTSSPSVFDMPISITGWNNNVTLSDITIDGATATGPALTITTTKNITLTRVTSKNNTTGTSSSDGSAGTQGGAYLDNCLFNGTKCQGSGNVVVSTGAFDTNIGGDGLYVESGGTIAASNVDASGNTGVCVPLDPNGDCTGFGATFDNQHASKPKTLSLTEADDTFAFNNNYSDGLHIYSIGAVTLNNITANDNGTAAGSIPLGTDGNPLDGVGAVLQNSFTGATSASTLKISGTNQFNDNYSSGLSATSSAAITASNLDAENNGGLGAALLNNNTPFGRPGSTLSTSSSSIYNLFSANAFDGLDMLSNGAISVKNVTASGNGTSLAANGGMGALLENDYTTAASPITLSGSNTFNGNYSVLAATPGDTYGGLTVFSNGAIRGNNITAVGDLAGGGADFDNSQASSAQPVILTGVNIFANNAYYDGLDVFSRGAITVSNLNAIGNGTSASAPYGDGAYLDNCMFGGLTPACTLLTSQPVTLTGSNAFKNNAYDGLGVYTNGTVTLSSLSADSNGDDGAYIINNTSTFQSNVTLGGSDSFNDNLFNGLEVRAGGVITLKTIGLSANANGVGLGASGDCTAGGCGLFLDNSGPTAKAISLSGASFFDDNQNIGLFAYSNGAVSASNVTALDNVDYWGVVVSNTSSVSLTGANVFNGNGHDGLSILSTGAITLNNVTADNDGQAHAADTFGVWLDNSAGTNQAVTLNGTNTFNGNYSGGIYVKTTGAIKTSNLTANDSAAGPGATLINDAGTSAITLGGFGTFNDNAGDGADLNSSGVITLTKITADGNTAGDGLRIDNGAPSYVSPYVYSGTPNNVVITCGSFIGNHGFGVNAALTSGKTLTLVGGVLIDNTGGDTPQTGSGTLINTNPVCPLP
ncbi:MAG TPA: hypothetical protein VLZ89_06710 [Anaerolineales bacterium]|nr:hypothetical protein [Anaerolineales bacterium]